MTSPDVRSAVPSNLRDLLARFLDVDPSGYILRMYWLGRADKIPDRELPLLEWLTQEFVPCSVLAKYTGFKPGRVSFQDEDHMALVQSVMAEAVEIRS